MILFFVPFVAALAFVIAVIVFGGAFAFVRKPSQLPNRFGSESATGNPLEAIISGFRRAIDFQGRANRMDFWAFAVFVALLCTVPIIVIIASVYMNERSWTWSLFSVWLWPALAIPSLTVAVRRLHDVNRSGWWVLLLCVFGWFVLLYWFLQPSQKETAELF
ncbi:MAG: DUF805 domain-containing protein [Asticcacaulis sp.]|uniref:DUF805 domain-containing protein n=1 Tax=Asticcacaulis sp. TaxID=1872648 RepID=UPI0039E30F19